MRTSYATLLADTLPLPFRGRAEAGMMLAGRLKAFARQSDVVVVAIANDGVPVAAQVATALNLPLTVQVVRKLGVPGQENLTMGTIASDDIKILNQETINALHIPARVVDWGIFCETQELLRRERVFVQERKAPALAGKTVILVDDGISSGSRMLAAIHAIRKQGVRRIVATAPVAAKQSITRIRAIADQVICLVEPKLFFSIGHWYENFEPVADWEVCQILDSVLESTPELQMA
jgi:putative phosphoribosyl transferase